MTKGLYLHIPFCKSKCRYCSFNSFSGISFLQKEYFDSMISGIKKLNNDKLDSVYIGGGTPSFVNREHIADLLKVVYDTFCVSDDAEITIEINPKTIDEEKLTLYRKVGINRISMGMQSMNDEELKLMGRAHTVSEGIKSYELIRKMGFDNVSLDLMYALPNQTEISLKDTLDQMIALSPEHISCYGLSIDEGTPLWDDIKKGIITKKDDEEYFRMYEMIREALAKNRYSHYEISNFSKPGFQARHNTSYWRGNEYYAMGAGASGFIGDERFVYTENVEEFIRNPHKYTVEETLTKSDKISEFVMLGLRMLIDGVDKNEFKKRFDKDIYQIFEKEISKHIKTGMLEDTGDSIRLTPKAYYVSNSIMADFIL